MNVIYPTTRTTRHYLFEIDQDKKPRIALPAVGQKFTYLKLATDKSQSFFAPRDFERRIRPRVTVLGKKDS